MCEATDRFLGCLQNPWLQLPSYLCKSSSRHERHFDVHADALLLCLSQRFGFGQWQKIHEALRCLPPMLSRFRLDYHLMSLSAEEIGKRIEQLMKQVEGLVDSQQLPKQG